MAVDLGETALPSQRDEWVPRIATVVGRHRETHDTWTLDLSIADDATQLVFAPGQFNMVYAFGIGEVPISVSGDPQKLDRFTHTVRSVGPVSHALTQVVRGAHLGVRGPYGSSWPMNAAEGRDVLVIAGGLGLAPLRPVLYALRTARARFGNVSLLYGARNDSDVLFLRELNEWRKEGWLTVEITVDHAGPKWSGRVGVVTNLVKTARFDSNNAIAMICGPELMMRYSAAALQAGGVTDDRIFVSLERNMKCAIGFCGHCQLGPQFVCKEGAVIAYDRVVEQLRVRER